MTTRRQALAFIAALLPGAALAQQKTARIGLLWLGAPDNAAHRAALMTRLRELGFSEGGNLRLEDRTGARGYEGMMTEAQELAHANVDVIVTFGSTAVRAAARATKTVPIIMHAGLDPVKHGLAASLARPGGNVTGITTLSEELQAKQLELLRDTVRRAKRVGALFSPGSDVSAGYLRTLQDDARRTGLELQPLEVRVAQDIDAAFAQASTSKVDAVLVVPATLFTTLRTRIGTLALQHRLPCFGYSPEFADAGALVAYGFDRNRGFRRAADYAAQILRGTRPADLPIERSADFELVVNLKTARALGISVPTPVLLRATRTIE
jgi:putative ABC transport system substrate-binding protein